MSKVTHYYFFVLMNKENNLSIIFWK